MAAHDVYENKELVPWLLLALNEYSNETKVVGQQPPPIEWTNEKEGEFLIRWYRTSKKDVNNPNSRLFVKYAKRGLCDSTQGGETKTDPQQASIGKRNLRSALHKSDMVEELTDRRQGPSTSEPFRVYKFLQTSFAKKRSSPSPSQSPVARQADSTTRSPGHPGTPGTPVPLGAGASFLPDLPEFMGSGTSSPVTKSEGNDYREDYDEVEEVTLDEHTLLQGPSQKGTNQGPVTQVTRSTMATLSPQSQSNEVTSSDMVMDTDIGDSPSALSSPGTHLQEDVGACAQDAKCNFWVVVRYCGQVVACLPSFVSAYCIKYQKVEPIPTFTRMALSETDEKYAFGHQELISQNLPDFDIPQDSRLENSSDDEKQLAVKNGQRVLNEMYRGIEFDFVDGDIYVTRYCKCGVLYVSQETNGIQTKVERVKKTVPPEKARFKIFDFQKYFKEKLHRHYLRKNGPEPHPFVYLSFGQKFSSNLHVDMVLASQYAIDALHAYNPGINIDMNDLSGCHYTDYTSLKSKTDTLDQKVDIVKAVSELALVASREDQEQNTEPMETDNTN